MEGRTAHLGRKQPERPPSPSPPTLRNRVGMEEDVKEYMLDDVGDFSSEAAASAFESVDKDKSGAMWTFISHPLSLAPSLTLPNFPEPSRTLPNSH